MNTTTQTSSALSKIFPSKEAKPVRSTAPVMNETKAGSKWWGYVSKRGTVRAKRYVEHSETGRRTTKAFIEWCGDYIAANTEPFASGSKKDALALTHKLLAAKIAELQKLKTKK